MRRLGIVICMFVAAGGCRGSGLGDAVRKDVTMQMEGAKPKLRKCYESALLQDSKMKGALLVRFKIEADSGSFSEPEVRRADMDDPVFEGCVLGAIEKLALRTPQKTNVSVDYPVYFTSQADDDDDADDDTADDDDDDE
jgi:hypothetical protein